MCRDSVSPDGKVVVGHRRIVNDGFAFRRTAASGVQDLGDLLGGIARSHAYTVSADGSVVVGRGLNAVAGEAFIWTEETGMVGLGVLPGIFASTALAFSGDGTLVFATCSAGPDIGAVFLWNARHGMRPFQDVLATEHGLADALKGWTLRSATAISTDGRTIVGWGINPEGWSEAWRTHLGAPFRADFNTDAVVNSRDFFDYIAAFFAGCVG